MNSTSKLKLNSICMFLFGVASIASYFPPLRALIGVYIPSVACLVASLLYILLTKKVDKVQLDITMGISIAALVFIAAMCILSGNSVLFNRYISLCLFIAGYPLFRVVLAESTDRSKKAFLIIASLFAIASCLKTCHALVANPYLSRSIKSEGVYSQGILLSGVGGYELVYFSVLAAIAVLPGCFSRNRKFQFANIAAFLIFALLVVLSNYMTALIVLIIGSILVLVYQVCSGTQLGVLVGVIMILVIGTIVAVNLGSIVEQLASAGGGGRVSNVLLGSESLLLNITNEFFADRAPVMQQSMCVLLDNPVIGSIGLSSAYGDYGVVSLAGQHSFVLDTFAYYGVLGGMLIIGAVMLELRQLVKTYSAFRAIPIAVSLIILILFNNATASIASLVFILFPLFQECNGGLLSGRVDVEG